MIQEKSTVKKYNNRLRFSASSHREDTTPLVCLHRERGQNGGQKDHKTERRVAVAAFEKKKKTHLDK